MGGVGKFIGGLFGGGGGGSEVTASVAPAPVPPPIAPPAYSNPHGSDSAGNVSNSQRAAGAFSDTIITGPEGLKEKESTSSTNLKTTLGS